MKMSWAGSIFKAGLWMSVSAVLMLATFEPVDRKAGAAAPAAGLADAAPAGAQRPA
jgi:hypothetical protein